MFYIFKALPTFFVKYKKQSVLVVIALLIELGFETLLPVSFKIVVDYAIIPQDFHLLVIILCLLVGVALLASIMGFVRDYKYARVGSNIVKDLYEKLFRHTQEMSMEFFSRRSAGDLLAKYNTDLSSVDGFIMMLPYVFLSFFGLILNVFILFILQWKLALLAMVGLSVCLIGPKLFGNRAFATNYQLKEVQAKITGEIQENIGAQTVIKAFSLQSSMNKRFTGNMSNFAEKASKSHFFSFLVDRTSNLGTVLLNIITIVIGSFLAFQGMLSIGSLLAFSTILITIGHLVVAVTWITPQMMQASAGMQRIQEIFDEKPTVMEAPNAMKAPLICKEISLHNVSFGYTKEQTNLLDINLRIPYGSYAAFVGSSGSGKSTIINLLMRFFDPSKGSIQFDGVDIAKVTQHSLREQIGIVFQENFLFNISLRENILFGKPDATEEEMIQATRAAEIHNFIESLPEGYDTLAGERGNRLSGGQRQRIGIARAIIRNPRLLILDEATSALDPATEEAINRTILKLAGTTTIVSITHRLSSVEHTDHIFVLDKGKLVENGTHQDLLTIDNGKYAEAWEKQTGFSISNEGDHVVMQPAKLKKIPLFGNLENEFLEEIAPLFVTETYPKGRIVIQEGEEGDKFYIIVRGKIEVSKQIDGQQVRLNVLSDGDFFGEIALLQNVTRTATIETLTPTIFITLNRELFKHIIDKYPSLKPILMAERR